MKLTFVRHGKTDHNAEGIIQGHRDGVLTKHGEQQALEAAESLKGKMFDHIYCSDLKRCKDTARPILKALPNTPITYTEQLREMTFGDYEGLPSSSINWDKLPGTALSRKAPNGESGLEMRARVIAFTNEVLARHPQENILFITHGGVIRNIIATIDNLSEKQMFDLAIANTEILERDIISPLTDHWL